MNQYISKHGEVTIDLLSHLSTQSAINIFSLRSQLLSLHMFQYIVNSYFKPWHFDHLIRIDIINISLGAVGNFMLYKYCISII